MNGARAPPYVLAQRAHGSRVFRWLFHGSPSGARPFASEAPPRQFMHPPPCIRQHCAAPQPTGSDGRASIGEKRLNSFSRSVDSQAGQAGVSLPRTSNSLVVPQEAQVNAKRGI
jgi:hypothetical protein